MPFIDELLRNLWSARRLGESTNRTPSAVRAYGRGVPTMMNALAKKLAVAVVAGMAATVALSPSAEARWGGGGWGHGGWGHGGYYHGGGYYGGGWGWGGA